MMKNSGLKVLSISVAVVVVAILLNSKQSSKPVVHQTNVNNFNEAIASQFNDNIRDVSARLQETEKQLSLVKKENQFLQVKLNQPQPITTNDFKDDIAKLKKQIANITQRKAPSYPTESSSERGHIQDLDKLLEKTGAKSHPSTSLWENQQTNKKEKPQSTLFYTIPAGTDFSKVTLLSALIGEVPVEGKLMQPLFPFSAMVGKGDLMTANGMTLPDAIVGMKVNGYAIGVGSFLDNISCVRAYITSALFVFDDGHFVTVGQEQMKSSSELINNDSIGYLTSQYGNPCIKGQYISNAPQAFTSMMAAGGIKGAGAALSKWQMSYQAQNGNTITTPTGQMGQFAAGGAISEGSQAINEWLEKRIQGSFDMVFVPASVKYHNQYLPNQFNLHFNQTINIDKALNGRRLDYGQSHQSIFDNALR